MKLIATITVDYTCNGVEPSELKEILSRSIESMPSDGGFTADSPAEVYTWNYSIAEAGNDSADAVARLVKAAKAIQVSIVCGGHEDRLESSNPLCVHALNEALIPFK